MHNLYGKIIEMCYNNTINISGGIMKIYSVNDILREKIYNMREDKVFEWLNNLNEKNRTRCIELLTSDALKILCLKSEKNTFLSPSTKELYEFLKDADIDEIEFYVNDNVGWFTSFYLQAKQFYQIPIVDRCLLMKSILKRNDKQQIFPIDTYFILDSMVYTLRKDLDQINEYYKDYVDKSSIDSLPTFYFMIMALFDELREENEKQFQENYNEIIKKFYISYKYTEASTSLEFPNSSFSKSLLEKNDLEFAKEAIFSLPELFCEVLSFYFLYMNDDLFDKEEIKDFSDKRISLEMKKKLGI